MKLPPRRILRSIVQDAIEDREAFEDPSVAEYTQKTLAEYRRLLEKLGPASPGLSSDDHRILINACRHARIWRESYYDAWAHTGDKAVILATRQDIDRVNRTEAALGVVHREIEGEMISIFDLHKRGSMQPSKVNGLKAA